MRRKDFLKRSMATLGMVTVMPIVNACGGEEEILPDSAETGTDGTTSNGTGECVSTPSETAGPFPTKDPSSLVRDDIRVDRQGIEMGITIAIQNKNDSCSPLDRAIVDIWHCDADGSYSEYGGTQMQTTNYSSVHFLRGRQVTNSEGVVSFVSIFPGWYSGRAPHIHVHVYNSSGKSLLVTQIAFPKDVCDTVYTTATDYYKKGKQDTTNERDGIFSDGVEQEMATVTGSVDEGFELTHSIVVSA
jgi:protocatechuate 3,4-dioxygenase beta subunit